jgi:hypothetical protein
MKLLFRMGTAVMIMAASAMPVLAGVNAGGTLLAHDANLLMSQTDGSASICGQGTVPATCEQISTEIDGAAAADPAVFKVYAAFASAPVLLGITWGVHYSPDDIVLAAHGNCGSFELNDDTWPDTDTGSSVTWDTPETSLLVPVYWFAAYQYGAPGQFVLRDNPSQGGFFGDDSVPAVLDPIAAYGAMGFGEAGVLICPPVTGACCDISTIPATCSQKLQTNCVGSNEVFEGVKPCDPDPCPTTGACCAVGANCTVVTPAECAQIPDSYFAGLATACGPLCDAIGACCDNAHLTCSMQVVDTCVPPAVFDGVGTRCSNSPCAEPVGACCVEGEACFVSPESSCLGGEWLGGQNKDCRDPMICSLPVQPTTWGQIKARYKDQ